jgi:hypothetical protein
MWEDLSKREHVVGGPYVNEREAFAAELIRALAVTGERIEAASRPQSGKSLAHADVSMQRQGLRLGMV